jgi:hypothetical protein
MSGTKLSSCCISGHIHKGTPEGKTDTIADLPVYVAGSNASKTLVLITVRLQGFKYEVH